LAMALSLPPGDARNHIAEAVFGVVVFSVLAQGSTLPGLLAKWLAPESPENASLRDVAKRA
jgi:NhaP-type Na+/H+ or K+/H+ antiporter